MTDEPTDLSYASYFEDPVKRKFIRAVEVISGQPKIKKLYDHYVQNLKNDEPFFSAAVRLLELDVQFNAARLQAIPKTGPLVIVANHPFGVLDGLVICWLASLRRDDFKILTNSALDGAPEARPYLLPIDFAGTREAMATNIATRKEALALLKSGGCIIIFPAGGVATAPRPLSKVAVDDEWKPFTAKLIGTSGAHVTPVFFEGQNSRLFQIASHVSAELRLALIFREVKRRMGKPMPVHIGETLTPDQLGDAGKRAELMTYLRNIVYGMSAEGMPEKFAKASERFQAKKPKVFR